MSDERQPRARRVPLDERMAERPPRERGPDPTWKPVRTPARVAIDDRDELAVAATGVLMLEKLATFGQSRSLPVVIDELRTRLLRDLDPQEVMKLEVEAYELLDWLIGGAAVEADARDAIAHRTPDGKILYDPRASIPTLIQRAIDESFPVRIDYFSKRRGEMNTRRITPIAIEAEIYVRAYCHARRAERVFRMNRITRCVPVDGAPGRPPEMSRSGEHEAPPRQMALLEED